MLQNELFYSYVDDCDKEYMAIEAAFDIEMQKQLLALEYTNKLYDIKLMQSDLRVLNESGTYEDLATLYDEAGEEANEKKDGIIKTIFNKLATFIQNIIESIKKLFGGQSLDAATKAAEASGSKGMKMKDPNKIISALSGALDQIQKFLLPNAVVTDEDGEKVISIAGAAGDVIRDATVIFVGWKALKPLIQKGQDFLSKSSKAATQASTNPPKGNGAPKVATALSDLVKKARGAVGDWIKGLFSKGKNNENGEGGDNAEGDNGKGGGFLDKAKGALSAGVNAVKGAVGKGNNAENGGDNAGESEGGEAAAASGEETKKAEEFADDFLDGLGFMESAELSEACDDILGLIDEM